MNMNINFASTLPCERDLEDLVSSYERGQSGQALFARTPNTHQQGITSRCSDYPRHLQTHTELESNKHV